MISSDETDSKKSSSNDGYGVSWLKTLDAVEALPADIIVPGHGPIPQDPKETRQGLHRFRQMLVDLCDAVQNEINRGATEDQAAAVTLPQYQQMQKYKSQGEVSPRRARAGKSWARLSEMNSFPDEVSRLIKRQK